MNNNNKDVIYVDVEDEITNIIDKVSSSKSKVVALVLPKRATVFQSVVNMKLLKKKANDVKKNVVLVTSEAGLLPLAGAVGVHVAKSLQAQPQIPPNPTIDDGDESPISVDDALPVDSTAAEEPLDPIDPNKSIGELAGAAAVGATASKGYEPEETIEFDNDAVADPTGLDAIGKGSKTKKPKKASKVKGLGGKATKIPDFNKFRKILLIGVGALILLIFLYILCFKVLPRATITVQTNTSQTPSNLKLTLSQADGNLNPATNTVPAKLQTVSKNSTSTPVNTTGSKTIGTSASGTVTVTNNLSNTNSYTIPAGTVFTDSSGNFSYTSNSAETIQGFGGSKKGFSQPSVTIPVTATQIGPNYNIGATSYSSNDPTLSGDSYQISGSAMSGGASNNVQVVAQADINSAESQLSALNSSQVQQQLSSGLSSAGYTPITATYNAGKPIYTPSAALGAQANNITVSESVSYTMYGIKQSDVDTLIKNSVNQQINPATQSILSTGSSKATYTLVSTGSASDDVNMVTSSTVGPKLVAGDIAKQSVAKKSGDIKDSISQTPGVTTVTVKYSPFWVTATPNNVKKIKVVIEKADGSKP